MKVLYNVTVKVDHDIHTEWYEWMKNNHIPKVMNTNKFLRHRFLKIIGDEDQHGMTYAIQYECVDMDTYMSYQKECAAQLQAETHEKYKDKVLAFRTLMEIHE